MIIIFISAILHSTSAYDVDYSTKCTCSDLNYQGDCELFYICKWSNGACAIDSKWITTTPSTSTSTNINLNTQSSAKPCSSYTEAYSCSYGLCVWDNNLCRPILCSDLSTEYACLYAFSNDFTKVKLCIFKNRNCYEATSLPSYNESTCLKNTAYLYRWNVNSQTCDKCTGSSSSFGYFLKVLGLNALIMIL